MSSVTDEIYLYSDPDGQVQNSIDTSYVINI